jgi:tRNA threonylcarbamoyladenosine biosynthesis protein TsaE
MTTWTCALPSEEIVSELAGYFAKTLEIPLVIYLYGDLGAGKTTFARALMRALGYQGRVKSPSYGLLEPYEIGDINVLHLDLYRVDAADELEYLAIRDLFDLNSLLIVEWPEKGAGSLPKADLELRFGETNDQRFVQCRAISDVGAKISKTLKKQSNMEFLDSSPI